jgi:predicted metalloprotease
MRWTPGGLSSDVEDRRGDSGGGFGGGGLGIVGFLILLVVSLVTGRNYIGAYFSSGGAAHVQQSARRPASPQEDRSAQFASFVLGDVQDTWTQILARDNIRYPRAHLVLFRDYTRSRCGTAQSATGPFYCPADQKVYLDLGFWDELNAKCVPCRSRILKRATGFR